MILTLIAGIVVGLFLVQIIMGYLHIGKWSKKTWTKDDANARLITNAIYIAVIIALVLR